MRRVSPPYLSIGRPWRCASSYHRDEGRKRRGRWRRCRILLPPTCSPSLFLACLPAEGRPGGDRLCAGICWTEAKKEKEIVESWLERDISACLRMRSTLSIHHGVLDTCISPWVLPLISIPPLHLFSSVSLFSLSLSHFRLFLLSCKASKSILFSSLEAHRQSQPWRLDPARRLWSSA